LQPITRRREYNQLPKRRVHQLCLKHNIRIRIHILVLLWIVISF